MGATFNRAGLFAAVLVLLSLTPVPAAAWGGLGHRTVAAIALALLPADKVQKMNALLSQLEMDNNAIDAASYPDEYVRDHDASKGNWHFADLPDDDSPFTCGDCLFSALPANLAILRQGKGDHDEAVALAWVIHLVGDLHQPLHMEARLRGGNGFAVTYRGKATCRNSYTKNPSKVELHSAWDDCLVEELSMARLGHSHDPQGLATVILGGVTSYAGRPEAAASGDTPWTAWGQDAHKLAISVAFDSLSSKADLQDAYISGALPVVQQQLLAAGIRLAVLLDANYSPQ